MVDVAAAKLDALKLEEATEWPDDEKEAPEEAPEEAPKEAPKETLKEQLAIEWAKFDSFKSVKMPSNDEEAVQQLRDAVYFNGTTRRWCVTTGMSFLLLSKDWNADKTSPFRFQDYGTALDFEHDVYPELHGIHESECGAKLIDGHTIEIPACSPVIGWCSPNGCVKCVMVALNGWNAPRLIREIRQIRIDAEREANGLASAAKRTRVG